jgi:hypothetical protein
VTVNVDGKDINRSLPSDKNPDGLTVEEAVELLKGPTVLGQHQETGLDITLRDGRFGAYYKHGPLQISVGKMEDGAEPSLEHAIMRLDRKAARQGVFCCIITVRCQWPCMFRTPPSRCLWDCAAWVILIIWCLQVRHRRKQHCRR